MGFHEKFCEEIVKASEADQYPEAIKEWKVEAFRNEDYTRCICSHDIVENCHVSNVLNGCRLIIGNCCIKKFFPDDQVEEFLRLRREAINKTRECRLCKRRYPKEGAESTVLCNFCHNHNLECVDCGEYFECSDPEKRKWCKRCPPDWQKWKGLPVTFERRVRTSRRKTKECAGCGIRIPVEPSWKNLCGTCYFERHN